MRKLLLALFVLAGFCAQAQIENRLIGDFDYAVFKTEDNLTYVEAYMKVYAGSYTLKRNSSGTYSGDIEITISASSTTEELGWADKYKLTTGELSAKDTATASFIDGKRFMAKEGKYRVDLVIRDLNSPTPSVVEYSDTITVGFPVGKPVFATPVLIDRYYPTTTENWSSRSGVDIIPNPSGSYSGKDTMMAFYTEVYGTPEYFGEGQRFVLKYYIRKFEANVTILGTERIMAVPVQKVYGALFPISLKNVGPGYHSLVVELRDKSNQVVTSVERVFYKGSKVGNNITDLSSVGTDFMALVNNTDSLKEFILCLDPISGTQEQSFARNVMKNGDKELMKKYIVSFWLNKNPENAQLAWLKYKAQVAYAQQIFGTQYLRAYRTDRGRVFLQYGPPNVRTERPNEPGAWPYEIWQYYELYNPITSRRFTNRRFVFWCRNEASNNYELLHSDALGEQKNERWEMVLYNRGKGTTDGDQTAPEKQPGGQSRDLYNSPR